MNHVLVDSNVILDVFLDDPSWADYSTETLNQTVTGNDLLINPIIYTEIAIGFARIEELEAALEAAGFQLVEIPQEALFLAGKVFLQYKRNRGKKSMPLPDFFIGAHAAVLGIDLITRDVNRYRTYFPTLS